MFIVLALLLLVAALLAVAYPILTKGSVAKPTASARETLDELTGQHDAAMQALRELNFDHKIGKVSDEDFAVFEASLKHSAADSLRALDRWEVEADDKVDRALEHEIAARKTSLTGGARPCPSCGRPAAVDDKFCAICGAPLALAPTAPALPAGQAACPKCGRLAEPGDRFCAGCGQGL